MNDSEILKRPLRVIISGGGTAGHIYPAVSVADALRAQLGPAGVEILFVGAEGKMEMERVPKAGYEIVGLPVAGLQRHHLVSRANLALPFKVMKSIRKAKAVVREFQPDVVAGFGGYASAPVLWVAQRMGIPTVIQEQNSFAGLTNRLLAKRAKAICVAYDGMERFFPAAKVVLTGNPLRGHFSDLDSPEKRAEAYDYFGFVAEESKKTLVVVGGSLGTRTLNRCMLRWLDTLAEQSDHVQVIWQNGKYYDAQIEGELSSRPGGLPEHVWRGAFVERMDLAYAIADVVVARAGACTVSELELVGRPVIFVPSPNVAEDHQTKNAQALVAKNAALLVPDAEAEERVIPEALDLLADGDRCRTMVTNILKLGRPDAAHQVVRQILKTAETYGKR